MSNTGEYYDHLTYPATGAAGSSAAMRAELDAIEAGLNKLPTMAANGNKLVKVAASADNLEVSAVISDDGTDATVAGDLYVTGGQIGQNSGQKHTIPAVASDTLALLAAVQTFINKTIVAANNTITTAASGNLAATELNAALAELQADIDTRLDKSGDTITGSLAVNGNTTLGDAAGDSVTVNGASWTFAGATTRIKGDFSNGSLAARAVFQTTGVNGNTQVGIMPNGSGNISGHYYFSQSSDLANSEIGMIQMIGGSEFRILSSRSGVGSFRPMTFYTGDVERMKVKTDGSVVVTSPALLGYDAGAGGTVTQPTSKATAVTLNKPAGLITMNNAALASGTTVAFTFNNSLLSGADVLSVNQVGGGDPSNYLVWVGNNATGSCIIRVRNISAGSLSDAVALNFTVSKGASS